MVLEKKDQSPPRLVLLSGGPSEREGGDSKELSSLEGKRGETKR